MINALNSGARVFMADLEDALSPTWANVVGGQAALREADPPDARRSRRPRASRIGSPSRPRRSSSDLAAGTSSSATCTVDGRPVSASLFDFGLFLFHNGAEALARRDRSRTSTCPSWRAISRPASGTTCSSPARRRSASRRVDPGDGAHRDDPRRPSRWTRSCTSCASTRRVSTPVAGTTSSASSRRSATGPDMVLPDRAQVTMAVPFMRAYTQLLVRTCHRRGAHAIGGMSAFIPNRREPEVTANALARVREDKEREAGDGFDGTWVAHPDLVPVAAEVFDRGARRSAEPEGSTPRGRRGRTPATSSTSPSTAGRSPRPASARTSASGCSTSTRGSAATARRPSTT